MDPTDRNPIRQLPPALVNRIAAGEVVERPASVVKELVENALDAGATQILVEIEGGGRELVRVVDDGRGVRPAELPLAFAAHATSKISSDADLFAVRTMGFRGEALASIGSVARCRFLSRAGGEDVGYEVHNRGGEVSDPQAAAANAGTTVEVHDLFFNVPARRRFLKAAATESANITDAVYKLALPHPAVGFKLVRDGRTAMDLPAGDELTRWLAGWPGEYHDRRLPLDARDAELRLRGILGLPELAATTGRYQFVFVNGRAVRDKTIQHALREGFRGLTEPGRHPAAVLLLEVPPADVDVNVHPTKSEVRFRDAQRVHGLVLSAIREVMLGNDLTPKAAPRLAGGDPQEMRSRLAAFFQSAEPGRSQTHPADALGDAPHALDPQRLAAPLAGRGEGDPRAPQAGRLNGEGSESGEADQPVAPRPQIGAIQLHNSYLVAESDEGLEIIDQHALHERILYEDLLARVSRGPLESQRMLIPHTFTATAGQIALVGQIAPLLKKLGIEAEAFGPAAVAVRAFPSFLHRVEPAEFVKELLEKGEQDSLDLHGEELLHDVLDLMACKAAVKAGDRLTPAEIDALLARRHGVSRSSNCPHGRPTTLKLSIKDLEKQFKRTGF